MAFFSWQDGRNMTETVPKSGEYQSGKCWFERRGEILTLGLTSRAIEELGQIEGIDFPDDGGDYDKGEALLRVEGSRGSFDLMTPAAGIVHEINSKAREEPDTVAEDPLDEGWLVRLEIQDPTDLADQDGSDEDIDDEDFDPEGEDYDDDDHDQDDDDDADEDEDEDLDEDEDFDQDEDEDADEDADEAEEASEDEDADEDRPRGSGRGRRGHDDD